MITSTQNHYTGQQGWNDCPANTFISAQSSNSSSKATARKYNHSSIPPPPLASSLSSSTTSSPPTSEVSTRNNSISSLYNNSTTSSCNTSTRSSISSPTSCAIPPPPTCSSYKTNITNTTTTTAVISSSADPTEKDVILVSKTTTKTTKTNGSEGSLSKITESSIIESESLNQSSDETPSLSNNTDAEITPSSVVSKLQLVLDTPSSLPSREFSHYKVRLEKLVPDLGLVHLVVVNTCFEQILGSSSSTSTLTSDSDSTEVSEDRKKTARETIIRHMMNHEAVSNWAVPLRKVIESIQL